ncbi:MAG: autotransporter-associated beta strand repeat-containing protein, partial [Kiritimatiellia bacterium]
GVNAVASAALDYTWLAQPLSAKWLGDANWDKGVWSPDAANTATIGASGVPAIDVNGTVGLSLLTVNADAALDNGTLALDGPFVVGAGATAVVGSGILQTDAGTAGTRFDKAGPGTLVLTGTNRFHRLRVSDGLLHFRGGVHDIVGTHPGPAEGEVVLSLARGRVLIDDGAVVTATNDTPYFSNSGADVVISNGTLKVADASEFLNGFNDDNKEFGSSTASITVETNGVLEVGRLRLSKGTQGGTYGAVRVNRGGTIRLCAFTMDDWPLPLPYSATLIFDGGRWEAVGGEPYSNWRLGKENAEADWPNVTVALGEGGLYYVNTFYSFFHKPITRAEGVARDGGVHFLGSMVTYWYGNNSYTGGNYLESEGTVVVNRDTSFGAVPDEPEDNVFLGGGALHFAEDLEIHSNRNFRIAADAYVRIGTQGGKTGRIAGTFSPEGTDGTILVSDWWDGWTEFCPPEGRTNDIPKLHVFGPLRIGSGTTLVTQNCGWGIDDGCALFVRGDGGDFGAKGNLTVTGGVLRVNGENSKFTVVKDYGQVNVTGGLLDTAAQHEWLNGLGSPARTTVSGTGELRARAVRLSQSDVVNDTTGLPVCEVNVCTGGVVRLGWFCIDEGVAPRCKGCLNLNGGTVAARWNENNFIGTTGAAWENILVRVCVGGAIVDTDGFAVTIRRPLLSGCGRDGGLTKRGAGTLTLTAANTYNGPTRVEAGTLVFDHAAGYPGGHLDFPGATLQGKDEATPLVELPGLAFRDGCGVRVPGADALDEATFQGRKVVARTATPLAKVPELVLLDADGNEQPPKAWRLYLDDGGRTLRFGCSRGTVLTLR